MTAMALLARAACGGVLIYAGFSKAVGPSAEFAGALAAYRILPAAWVTPVAAIWPWLELFVGTYLFFGYFTRLSAVAALGLYATFVGTLASTLARGIDLSSCGCFGIGLTVSPSHTLILDAFLLILSAGLIAPSREPLPLSVDAWIQRGPQKT